MFPRHGYLDFFWKQRIPGEFLAWPAGRGLAHGIFRAGSSQLVPGFLNQQELGNDKHLKAIFNFQPILEFCDSREKPVWFLGAGAGV